MSSHTFSSGLSRRRFLRTTVGATGAAVGAWRWLALVGAAAAEATPAISAPVLGGALGGLGVSAAPALAAGLSRAAAQSASTTGVLVFSGAAQTTDGPLTVAGESLDALHPGGVDVLEAALGFKNPANLTQGTGSKVRFDALRVTKAIDAASPLLFRLLGEGAPLPEMQLFLRPTGASDDQVVLRFGPAWVSAIEAQTQRPPADDVQEIVTFVFESVELTYTPPAPSVAPGAARTAAWDQVQNTPTFAAAS